MMHTWSKKQILSSSVFGWPVDLTKELSKSLSKLFYSKL